MIYVVIFTLNFDSRNIDLIIPRIPYVTTPTIVVNVVYNIEITTYFIYKLSLKYTSSFGLNKLKIMHDIYLVEHY